MGQSMRRRVLALLGASAAVGVSLSVLPVQPASASPGNWSLTDCRLGKPQSGPVLNAKWHIHNLDPDNAHGYVLDIVWGEPNERLGRTRADFNYSGNDVGAGERKSFDITIDATSEAAAQLPAGPVSCEVTYLRDNNNEIVKPVPK